MNSATSIVCVILGAGGHARVLIDALQTDPAIRIAGALDTDTTLWGKTISDVRVLGGDAELAKLPPQGVTHFVVGVGSTGDSQARRRVFAAGLAAGLKPLTVRHGTVVCSPFAQVADGAQLLPGCIVNTGAQIGCNVIINTGAIIEHDCWIEEHAHIAPGARLAGNVHVGPGAHVGLGACVLPNLNIGDAAIVGAGAVVTKDVPAQTVVTGVPARVIR